MIDKKIGPYNIIEKIGLGGMAVVYKAVHMKLDQVVAIKVLSPQFSEDGSMRERFIKEAKIQASFSHPNVVNILNYIEEDRNVFLIMEYVNGENLESRLKREGRLPAEEAVSISLAVLEALDFMHSKGVIHRDIKPSNVMFSDRGVVKVTDFGIAKVIGEKGQTKTGMIGTFRYMSPEQILGEETGVASDVYSFGVALYEMVTGRVPFSGDSEYKIMKGHMEEKPPAPWIINPGVSKGLGRIMLKSLSKNPKDRYQSAGEFKKVLITEAKKSRRFAFVSKVRNASLRIHRFRMRFLAGTLVLAAFLFVSIFIFAKRQGGSMASVSSPVSQPNAGSYRERGSNISFRSPLYGGSDESSQEDMPISGSDAETVGMGEINDRVKDEESLIKDPRKKKSRYKKKTVAIPGGAESDSNPKEDEAKKDIWRIRK